MKCIHLIVLTLLYIPLFSRNVSSEDEASGDDSKKLHARSELSSKLIEVELPRLSANEQLVSTLRELPPSRLQKVLNGLLARNEQVLQQATGPPGSEALSRTTGRTRNTNAVIRVTTEGPSTSADDSNIIPNPPARKTINILAGLNPELLTSNRQINKLKYKSASDIHHVDPVAQIIIHAYGENSEKNQDLDISPHGLTKGETLSGTSATLKSNSKNPDEEKVGNGDLFAGIEELGPKSLETHIPPINEEDPNKDLKSSKDSSVNSKSTLNKYFLRVKSNRRLPFYPVSIPERSAKVPPTHNKYEYLEHRGGSFDKDDADSLALKIMKEIPSIKINSELNNGSTVFNIANSNEENGFKIENSADKINEAHKIHSESKVNTGLNDIDTDDGNQDTSSPVSLPGPLSIMKPPKVSPKYNKHVNFRHREPFNDDDDADKLTLKEIKDYLKKTPSIRIKSELNNGSNVFNVANSTEDNDIKIVNSAYKINEAHNKHIANGKLNHIYTEDPTQSNRTMETALIRSDTKKPRFAFSYDPESPIGPEMWRVLHTEWTCQGRKQSPIDIRTDQVINDTVTKNIVIKVEPDNRALTGILRNNGHAPTFTLTDGASVKLFGGALLNEYLLRQLHFHFGCDNCEGSEHKIDGQSYPVELHLVFWDNSTFSTFTEAAKSDRGIAVVAILFERSFVPLNQVKNLPLTQILRVIKKIEGEGDYVKISEIFQFSLEKLIPNIMNKEQADRFFTYEGSLSTPGCYESVIWIVYDTHPIVTDNQLEIFRRLKSSKVNSVGTMCNNFRPIQKSFGRRLYSNIM